MQSHYFNFIEAYIMNNPPAHYEDVLLSLVDKEVHWLIAGQSKARQESQTEHIEEKGRVKGRCEPVARGTRCARKQVKPQVMWQYRLIKMG